MRRDSQSTVAIILAIAISLILVIGVGGAAWSGRGLSESGRDLLIAIGGAIVGALAGFLGTKTVVNGK